MFKDFEIYRQRDNSWDQFPMYITPWNGCFSFFLTEAIVHWCSSKMVFLKIAQISLENACVAVTFIKKRLQKKDFFIKKRLQHRCFRCFPVKFAKLLRKPIFIEHLVAVISFKKVWFLNQNIHAQLLERNLKVFERWLPISNFLKLLIVSLHKKWSFP